MIGKRSAEWRSRILDAPRQYDMPIVSTNQLVAVVRGVAGYGFARTDGDPILNLLDVIWEIMPDATIQDVKIATYLIGEDFEPDDIRMICYGIANGRSLAGCEALTDEQKDSLKKILEAKP